MGNILNRGAVVVTGGSSPIALSISQQLSKSSKVLLLTRDASKLRQVFSKHNEANIQIEQIDFVSDSCEKTFQSLVKVHNVTKLCIAHRMSPLEYSPLQRFVGEVLRPASFIEAIISRSSTLQKRAVVLTSPATNYVLDDQDYAYHANKSALSSLIRFFAVKHGSSNFAINGIAPGSFVMKERSKRFYEENPKLLENITRAIPNGKFTLPQDIAAYAEFLLFSAPITFNGTEVTIDSGLTLIEHSKLARRSFL